MNVQNALTTGNFNAGIQGEQARTIQETQENQALQRKQENEEAPGDEAVEQQNRPRPQEEGKGLQIDITA